MVVNGDVLRAEVVGLAGTRCELCRGGRSLGADYHEGLPIRANITFARVDEDEEVRVGVRGSHPDAIYAKTRGRGFDSNFESS